MGKFAHVRWLPSFLLSGVALGDVTFSCLVDWPRGAALFAQTSLPSAQGSLAPGGFLHVLCPKTVLMMGRCIQLRKNVDSYFLNMTKGSFLRPTLLTEI